MCDGETSFTNGANHGKNELVDNLKLLLTEHSQGISLIALEDTYKTKFSKSLLVESIKLALSDDWSNFVLIIPEDPKNGLSDSIIALKDEQNINQIQDRSLQVIATIGIVPKEFFYASNPFASDNELPFSAFIPTIDKRNQYIHIQPECYMQDMEKLTEELHIFYSDPIAEQLLVKDFDIGLACVNKLDGVYHRIYIMENYPSKCVIKYVDLGLTEEIEKDKIQFKHLLNYFAEVPCLSIACRLWDIEFKLKNFEMPLETYEQLNALCQCGPFDVEPHGAVTGVLNVKIYNVNKHCLNHILVERKLASQKTIPMSIASRNGANKQYATILFLILALDIVNTFVSLDSISDIWFKVERKDTREILEKNQ